MASYWPPKRATAFIMYVALESVATAGTFQSNPTLASGDVKCSLDGGSLTNLTTLPTVTPASGKMVKVSLSSSEMTADNVTIVFSDAAGSEWKDLVINLATVAIQNDDMATPTNITAGTITTATNVTTVNGLASGVITATSIAADAITAAKIADGAIDAATFASGAINAAAIATDAITASKIAADAIGASELAADAVAEIQSGLATPTNITAASGVTLAAATHTGAVIPTVTNLTNAPTNGDLTATMKNSVTTAATAATPTAASVTAPVTVGTNNDKIGYALTVTPPTAVQVRTEMDSNSTQLAKLGTPAGASVSADIAAIPTISEITDAIKAYEVETGHSFDTVLKALYAITRGGYLANDPDDPTQLLYYAPDGTTVRVTHSLTSTTRVAA